jgi:hypothetical protein
MPPAVRDARKGKVETHMTLILSTPSVDTCGLVSHATGGTMTRSLTILLVAAIAGGALVTGCGSSSSSNSTSSTASTAASTSTGASTTPSSGGASGGAAATPAAQAAVAACKQSFNAQPTLSAAAKTKLVSLCDKAASGNQADIKAATHDVCVQLAQDIAPAGAARDATIAACPK